MRNISLLFLLLLSVGLLGSCRMNSIPDSTDEVDLLLDSPCTPPCWYNITPGITTRSEAKSILNGLSFVENSSIVLNQAGNIGWKQISASEDVTGGILFTDSTVRSIYILPSTCTTTIQELIDLLGPPEGTWVSYVHLPEDGVTVTLIWPQMGLRANLEIIDYEIAIEQDQLILPESCIKEAEYFVPFESVYVEYPERLRLFQRWEGLESITLPAW
jgi:hypothetical protein